jgi:hypothetical protein
LIFGGLTGLPAGVCVGPMMVHCEIKIGGTWKRLTNAFSKKVENHAWSVALFTTFYNFVRIHRTLRVTPAMAAGVTDRFWEVGDIIAVVEANDRLGSAAPYRKAAAEISN